MCYIEAGGELVHKHDFEYMLEMVANNAGISKEQVRKEMQEAMEEAMHSPDPMVQMRWQFIPRKGEQPTLEEFVEFLLRFV